MDQNVIYVGPDADDEHYYGCALDKSTGEMLNEPMPFDPEGFVATAQQSPRVLLFGGSIFSAPTRGVALNNAWITSWLPRM